MTNTEPWPGVSDTTDRSTATAFPPPSGLLGWQVIPFTSWREIAQAANWISYARLGVESRKRPCTGRSFIFREIFRVSILQPSLSLFLFFIFLIYPLLNPWPSSFAQRLDGNELYSECFLERWSWLLWDQSGVSRVLKAIEGVVGGMLMLKGRVARCPASFPREKTLPPTHHYFWLTIFLLCPVCDAVDKVISAYNLHSARRSSFNRD